MPQLFHACFSCFYDVAKIYSKNLSHMYLIGLSKKGVVLGVVGIFQESSDLFSTLVVGEFKNLWLNGCTAPHSFCCRFV